MKLVEVFQQRDPAFRDDQPVTDLVRVASFRTGLATEAALSEAFRITNTDWDAPGLVIEPGEHRSTSVGDVVVIDGEAFQCRRQGWMRLPEFRRA